ncbi:uncharacterized protein [Nicotiana tomentosiformis]|uniref:uncharacterized protein n=1 Tax=Nicotiana tomentosiformis TaxID=4098 RepID=UPI00388C4622
MKSGKIVSQAALKATTQAIQSGSGNFGNRKKKEEGSMMASGFGGVQRGIAPSYAYARPPNHQQWQAPIPQGSRQLWPNFQAPYNPRPRQEYVREQEPKKEFTPIGESYTSLFRKLMQLKLIEPIMPRYVNPNSKGFDSNARCEYNSNTQGHSTKNCWTLKKAIENLIEAKAIMVTNNEDTPNIKNNPLPTHDNTHFIGMICDDRDYKQSGKTEMVVRTIGPEPKVIVSPPQLAALMVKGENSSLNLACSEKTILYVPGSTKKVAVQLGGPKLYIPGGIQKIILNNGLRNITEPVVIRPVAQLLVTNTKAIPWNYNKTVMTYKRKEIVEETGEMGGLTRSGRYYSPEELRKAKQARESQFPVKEPVVEKEAEEFFKKMKLQDYSIIDQLRKTPAHISLAVPSTLHQMVKFECDGQEIIVHGEDDSSVYKDPSIPYIEAKEGCESIIYQAFEVIEVDQVEEGKPILHPHLLATSMMVASLMLRNGYEPRKGLGSSLQGIVNPIALFSKKNTFGLGFKPTSADIERAKARKKNGWNLSKPIPHIAYSFVKPQFEEVQNPSTQDDIDGVCQGLKEMFYEINMVQVGKGPSRASVQLIGPDTSVSNWEATPLPIRKESRFDNAGFKNMTCMRNSCPDLKKLSNLEIMNQEVEYDEDEAFREMKRQLDQFENKPKPNLNETENTAIKWTDECQEAFDKIKEYLSNPPVLVLPEPGRPLFLYLSVMDSSFGCVLGQHDITGKREQEIYYLSKKFTAYEAKYTLLERTCCALTWAAQKLRHYLLAYTTYLISRMDPLKYIFQKTMPTGKSCSQNEEVNLVEEVVQDDSQIWKLYFDGVVNIKGVGIGTILVSPTGQHYPATARLRFFCTNNTTEYEACIMDNAANLNSHLMKEVCEQFKIEHRNSTPYRPKANGVVEAANKNIKKILRKMIQGSRQWHEKLPFALLGYRTTEASEADPLQEQPTVQSHPQQPQGRYKLRDEPSSSESTFEGLEAATTINVDDIPDDGRGGNTRVAGLERSNKKEIWEDMFVSLAAFTSFREWWLMRPLTLEHQFMIKNLDKYNLIVLRLFREWKGLMWFAKSVVDAKEYLVREFYANVAHIKKGTKVIKVRNLKMRFDQSTLNTYLRFEDVESLQYLKKLALGDAVRPWIAEILAAPGPPPAWITIEVPI